MSKTKISKIIAILVIMLLMLVLGEKRVFATDAVWDRYSVLDRGAEWMLSNSGWGWAKAVMQNGGKTKWKGDEDWTTDWILSGNYDLYCLDKFSEMTGRDRFFCLNLAMRVNNGTTENPGVPCTAEIMALNERESFGEYSENSRIFADLAWMANMMTDTPNNYNNWSNLSYFWYGWVDNELKATYNGASWAKTVLIYGINNSPGYSNQYWKVAYDDMKKYSDFVSQFNYDKSHEPIVAEKRSGIQCSNNSGTVTFGPCNFNVYKADTQEYKFQNGKYGTNHEIKAVVELNNGTKANSFKLKTGDYVKELTSESNLVKEVGENLKQGQDFSIIVEGQPEGVTISKVTFTSEYTTYKGVVYFEANLSAYNQARASIAGGSYRTKCQVEFTSGTTTTPGARVQIKKEWKDTNGDTIPAEALPASLPYTLLYYNTYGLTENQKQDNDYVKQHCKQVGYKEENLTPGNNWQAAEDLTELVSALQQEYGEEWALTIIPWEKDVPVVAGYNFVSSKVDTTGTDNGENIFIEITLTNTYEKEPDNPVPFIEFNKLNEKGAALRGARIGVTINNGEYYKTFRSNGSRSADVTILFNDLINTDQIQKDFDAQNAVELFNNKYSTKKGLRNRTSRSIR